MSSFDSELSVVIHSPPNPHPQLSLIMKEENGSGESSNTTTPKHKIQKVPKMLLQMGTESTEKCYEPQVVSIGPYHHHKNENLKSFEKFKFQFTREYVKSCGPSYSIYDLYSKVADVAIEARNCYAEDTKISATDFTLMMFLDGCFILQYIHYKTDQKEQAKMKMKNHDKAFVLRDLFLLENQLPFIVLKALMTMNSKFAEVGGLNLIDNFIQSTLRHRHPPISFQEWMENCITCITNPKTSHTEEPPKLGEPAHLLELVHRQVIKPNGFSNNCYSTILQKLIKNFCPKEERNKKEEEESNNWYTYRSVQELKTAGIVFRPNQERILSTDVRYEPLFIRAILRLPPMIIDDTTQSLLLNLVAYEMCPDSPNDYGVTSYIWFMDTLIDHADDVKELRKNGILLNYLSTDEEVAELFNEIAKNLVPDTNTYKDVQNQIEKHYKNKVRLWMTEWLHTHFDTPWTILAFLGAILAIVLSFIQTYIAINPSTNSTNSGK